MSGLQVNSPWILWNIFILKLSQKVKNVLALGNEGWHGGVGAGQGWEEETGGGQEDREGQKLQDSDPGTGEQVNIKIQNRKDCL